MDDGENTKVFGKIWKMSESCNWKRMFRHYLSFFARLAMNVSIKSELQLRDCSSLPLLWWKNFTSMRKKVEETRLKIHWCRKLKTQKSWSFRMKLMKWPINCYIQKDIREKKEKTIKLKKKFNRIQKISTREKEKLMNANFWDKPFWKKSQPISRDISSKLSDTRFLKSLHKVAKWFSISYNWPSFC